MGDSPSKNEEYYSLWWLVLHVRRALHKARGRELYRHGLTPVEASVLFVVETIGYRTTPAEISRWLLKEPHTISGLLDRMEKKGLITKNKDLDRKNLVRVELTEKGHEAYNQSLKRESIYNIMSVLSKRERQQMRKSLLKLFDKSIEELRMEREQPFPFPYNSQ